MKKRICIVLFLFSWIINGQKITYNFNPNFEDSSIQEVKKLFENYITSQPQLQKKNPFWNSNDQNKYKQYDFLENEFQPSLYMGFPIHILSIKQVANYYQIKAQFSYTKKDGTPYILAIVNYVAKKDKNEFKLYNSLSFNKEKWNQKKVGVINFYYPTYHKFNFKKATQLNSFVNFICSRFNIEKQPFEYYLADDFDEIQSLKGIDYYIGMGGKKTPKGIASEQKVYCGGLGELYKHEVFHVQIDRHFPNAHFWASEGIATFLGGSRGHSLQWHIQQTNNYLVKHPEIDLNEMLSLKNMTKTTSYHYVLGGLIAKKVYEKGGWKLLKKLLSSGKKDKEYYLAIEKLLGISKEHLNSYIRKHLYIEAQSKT